MSVTLNWKSRNLPADQAFDKMVKNARKNLEQYEAFSPFAKVEEALVTQADLKIDHEPVPYNFYAKSLIGHCKTDEDRTFVVDQPHFLFAGVLDGHAANVHVNHGRNEVTEYVCDRFKTDFSLKEHDNMHADFEAFIHQVQLELLIKFKYRPLGTTALITVVDKRKRLLYSCTIGDSKAYIFRQIDTVKKVIVASSNRDWCSKRDEKRALPLLNHFKDEWLDLKIAKCRRFPPITGINVSRSLGEAQYDYQFGLNNPISSKPKISVFTIKEGDEILLVSDGIDDYVKVDQMLKLFKPDLEETVQLLFNEAFKERSRDNMSAIAIRFEKLQQM